jgi:CPA2 family monovalent cation:H+ antiporter-2
MPSIGKLVVLKSRNVITLESNRTSRGALTQWNNFRPMIQHTPLIATLTVGLVVAFVMGAAANRLRISPLVGYLLAGIAVGPFTPGFVVDQELASQLAEVGVVLLMFGVGLHFSFKDLLSVKAIAIPGALVQIVIATLLGMGLSRLQGWPLGASFVFGLALSVASTVVLVRALQKHRLMETERGHIALGWLVVQDLAMVLALVLMPAIGSFLNVSEQIGTNAAVSFSARELAPVVAAQVGKVAAFVALMLIVGRRVIPWILHYVAQTGSRELFRLAVLAIALGVAFGAAEFFGVSFALGAFFAGTILHESPLSQRAAEESLPLRDAFAVLFFVSVGMLFDPGILLRHPGLVAGALVIILICNPLVAFLITLAYRRPLWTALTLAVSLAQIGEFSFILAGLGLALGLLPKEGRDLILAAAILSIFANPALFAALERFRPKTKPRPAPKAEEEPAAEPEELPVTKLTDHAIVVGFGRVGSAVGEGLKGNGQPFVVIDDRQEIAGELRARGIEVIIGNAAEERVLEAANLASARWLFVAIPDGFEAGTVVEQARKTNPTIEIVARAHYDAEVEHLYRHGANLAIMGEREIARGMLDHALGAARTRPAAGPA